MRAMADKADQQGYFEYLKRRSLLGRIYHRCLLYPCICAALQGSVLDFGCGIGGFLKFRPNTTGVDINGFNVEYCKSIGLNVELLSGGLKIPFNSNTFSGVVMDNVIEHIPAENVDLVLVEIVRVLETGGTVVAGIPGRKGYESDNDHKVFYTENDLAALFDKHGFDVKRSFLMPFPWQFLDQYIRQHCVYVVFKARV